jgi:hypothetical protein
VVEVARLLPRMADWPGLANREDLTWPVAEFRETATKKLGLLRKTKGRLLVTKAGAAVDGKPGAMFAHLATRLRPSTATRNVFADGGRPIEGHMLWQYDGNVHHLLVNVDERADGRGDPQGRHRSRISMVAAALARAALVAVQDNRGS